MSRDKLRGPALVAFAAAAFVALFLSCFERVTEDRWSGASLEARRNSFLAVGRFFEGMGHEVVPYAGPAALVALPPSYGTLFFTTQRRTLSERRLETVLEWVRAGGHLVVVTYSVYDDPSRRPDPILDPLGLEQYADFEAEEEPGEEESEDWEDLELPLDFGGIAQPLVWDESSVRFRDRTEPLVVNFDPRFTWVDREGRASWGVGGERGSHLLVVREGLGWITAMTDDWFLRNDFVGEADHAELALRLARMGGRDGPVGLVVDESWPGLADVAWAHARPAILAAAVLLVAWLWRSARRFGPMHPDPPPERRRWMEHLEAVGLFHWRSGGRHVLLGAAREALSRRMQARDPLWGHLSWPDRAQRLAATTRLPDDRVARALERPEPGVGETEFIERVTTLEQIRTSR